MTDYSDFSRDEKMKSLSHGVADYLADVISRLSPGERLGTKKELREQMGVSPSTVNEAVRLLVERGVVSLRTGPRGGIFAATPRPMVELGQLLLRVQDSAEAFSQSLDVRNALEPLVLMDAAREASPDDLDELDAYVEKMGSSTGNVEAFLRADLELHARIAAISSREIVSTLYSAVVKLQMEQLNSVVSERLPAPEHTRSRLAIHRDLVSAIRDGDTEAIERVAALHAQHSRPVDDPDTPEGPKGPAAERTSL